jgi:hypothetical protein
VQYYVEEWKPRPKWFELTAEDRGKVLFDLTPTMQTLFDAGVELIGYVVNRQAGPSSRLSFLRIWKMSEESLAQRVEDALASTTWHEFFEPGTMRGEVLTPQVAIPHLINP